jgi:glutathione synthase
MIDKIVAIQADPVSELRPESDSSLFIASELCRVGYKVFFYTPCDLSVTHDKIFTAKGSFVSVDFKDYRSQYSILSNTTINLRTAHIVMIRQNPPFNMKYITNCYILEQLQKYEPYVINDPTGIRANSEKMSVYKFPEFIPPSLIIGHFNELVSNFIIEQREVVIKPLYWFGGQFIKKISDLNTGRKQIETALREHGHIIIQKFLPSVYEGDKRIIIIDGKIAASMKRVPAKGNFIANLAAGGYANYTELSNREKYIAETIGSYLKQQGIFFAGLDMISEYLIEINVTSPTGLVAINKLYGINLAKEIVSTLEQKLRE